jgi:hypothetical protein
MSVAEQIEFMRNGMNVRRYHQYTTLETDTVGKHSCGVALFINLISPACSKDVLLAAVSHDLGEWVLGDIPAPTKRHLPDEARALLDSIEDVALAQHGYENALSPMDHLLLKVADYCDGLRFTIEEAARGNRTLEPVATAYIEYLWQLKAKIPNVVSWHDKAVEVIHTLIKQKDDVYER